MGPLPVSIRPAPATAGVTSGSKRQLGARLLSSNESCCTCMAFGQTRIKVASSPSFSPFFLFVPFVGQGADGRPGAYGAASLLRSRTSSVYATEWTPCQRVVLYVYQPWVCSSVACMYITQDGTPLGPVTRSYTLKHRCSYYFQRGSPCHAPALPIRHVHALADFMQRLTAVPSSLLSLLVRHRLARFCPVPFLRSIAPRITERTTGATGVVGPRGPHH